MKPLSELVRVAALSVALFVTLVALQAPNAVAQQAPRTFTSPAVAAAALISAAKSGDTNAILAVLGPATKRWILTGDKVQDARARAKFVADYERKHKIEMTGADRATLVIGDDDYPFAFPIVKSAAGWSFDPKQGREEILARRIGENELNTIQVIRAIADAQHDYANADRDGDGLRTYAAKFRSGKGKRDGLHWHAAPGEPLSPLGPLVARATAEGYKPGASATDDETGSYHGYRFKLLKKQGPNAPGGQYDYVVKGKMIGGFAVLAYPAKYGASGVMSFMINQDGQVYEADLGPETAAKAGAMVSFDPGPGWKKVKEDR